MKNLFRIHFIAIAVIDLLLFAFFSTRPETAFDRLLLTGFIFILAQGLLLFRLLVHSNINSLRFILKSIKRFASTI